VAYTSEIEKLERRWLENPKGRNFAPLADAYRKAGEVDRAIELCRSGLEMHPDYVSAHIVYGRCLLDQKADPEAEQVFQKVLSLDPENIIALRMLADLADRNNRFDSAVQWLTRLLAADPMNGDAAEALARAKGKASLAAKATEPMDAPPGAPRESGVRDSQLIDLDAAIAEAPTTAMSQPDFQVEHAAPAAPVTPEASQPPGDLEVFDGALNFNAAANAAAKADGIELQEEIELKADTAPLDGLARTQYEGSGMFRIDKSEELPPEPGAPESERAEPPVPPPLPPPVAEAPDVEENLPSVDLPLIMPDDIPAPVARKTPPPPPRARPEPAVPAAVALSDDDGAADAATLSKAEPVVTETMADLYLKQGHQEDALRVYQALLEQHPGDARLQDRVDQLSGRKAPPAPSRAAPAPPPARRKLAKAPGGQSALEFLRRALREQAPVSAPAATAIVATAATPPAAGDAADASSLESAFAGVSDGPAPEQSSDQPPGAPTLPAADNISLDAVFGDQGGRGSTPGLPPATPSESGGASGGSGGGGGGFSFDEFFGGQGGGGQAPPAQQRPRSSGRTTRQPEADEDLDQFQSWLKGLKS
jgi:tetratricopeptide (TPR) repeat protein